jgi:hypothetical protein
MGRHRRGRRLALGAIALASLSALALPTTAFGRPLLTGFVGFGSQRGGSLAEANLWAGRTRAAGARLTRLNVYWSAVAPNQRPAGFNPRDPGDPAYDWGAIDHAVRVASSHGLRVYLTVLSAPPWAEGPNRPGNAAVGAWKPNPAALADFAHAIGRRYSGRFQGLPRVDLYQAWNEPNFPDYIWPQWQNGSPVSAIRYRAMLNAFYRALKQVRPGAQVILGGTAPYGDRPGGFRVPPVTFNRVLLCLNKSCPDPPRFDIFDHHPINLVGGPLDHASNPLDIAVADMGELIGVLRRAERRRLPGGRHPVWVTELWWDTNPPDHTRPTVSPARQARWIQLGFNSLWRQGAQAVTLLQVRDSQRTADFATATGIFFKDGRKKPSYYAFRFPFVTRRTGARIVSAWGKPPTNGRVQIQQRRGGGWRTIRTVSGSGTRPFVVRLRLRGSVTLRAHSATANSLPWKQR